MIKLYAHAECSPEFLRHFEEAPRTLKEMTPTWFVVAETRESLREVCRRLAGVSGQAWFEPTVSGKPNAGGTIRWVACVYRNERDW